MKKIFYGLAVFVIILLVLFLFQDDDKPNKAQKNHLSLPQKNFNQSKSITNNSKKVTKKKNIKLPPNFPKTPDFSTIDDTKVENIITENDALIKKMNNLINSIDIPKNKIPQQKVVKPSKKEQQKRKKLQQALKKIKEQLQ